MGVSTLAGHRVTHARVNIPAWGCWYADASIDGQVTLSGVIELKIADLTLSGAVISGGPEKGRSSFRIVGGTGGWGLTIPAKSYTNDAGVKLSNVINDAAEAADEVIDTSTLPTDRVGPAWVRQSGPACRVLELLAPSAWYVGEDGITRLGARPTTTFKGVATRTSQVDLARGTVTLAAESIATLRPGIVVDGLEAVDVEHEVTPKGLRTTIWGKRAGGTSRRLAAMRALDEQLDPDRRFRSVWEYRVVTLSGKRLNLQPVQVSTGMPSLSNVPFRPGVAGCDVAAQLGSRVLVGFVNEDPARPYVSAFEDPDGEGFVPTTLDLTAGGMVGGEHVMTTEATALLIYNVLVAWCAAAGGGPLLAAVLQPLIMPAIITAITAQSTPAPPGEAAQTILATTLAATMASGTTPSYTSQPFNSVIDLVSTKTANESGFFPSVGSAAVRAG